MIQFNHEYIGMSQHAIRICLCCCTSLHMKAQVSVRVTLALKQSRPILRILHHVKHITGPVYCTVSSLGPTPSAHALPTHVSKGTGRMLGNCPCWIKFQMQLDPDRIIMNNLWPTLWCQCHVTCITEKVEEFSKVTLRCFVFTLAFCSLGGSC